MLSFVGKRLFQLCVSLYFVSVVLFSLTLLVPSDVMSQLHKLDRPPSSAEVQRQLELDRPPSYLDWAKHVVRGEFGESALTGRSVNDLIGERARASAELLAMSLLTALLIGVPLGLLGGLRGWPLERTNRGFVLLGLSVPNYVFSASFILVAWLLAGAPSEVKRVSVEPGWQSFTGLISPAIALALAPAAMLVLRFGAFIRQGSDVAKLRDVLQVVISEAALSVVGLMSGLIVVETIFAVPGLGQLAVEATVTRDYSVLIALALLAAVGVLILILIADVAREGLRIPRMDPTPGSPAKVIGPVSSDFARRSTVFIGGALLGFMILVAVVGLWFFSDEATMNLSGSLQAPSALNWLGTDDTGRDVFAQVVGGAGQALITSTVPVLVALAIGVSLGLCAGFFGRLGGLLGSVMDALVSALTDAILALPFLMLALLLASLLAAQSHLSIVAIAIATVPGFARLTRDHLVGDATALRGEPGLVRKLTIQTLFAMAAAGIADASLCLLGYGPPLPDPCWGGMIGSSSWAFTQAPWIFLSSALFIVLTALSFNLIAIGLGARASRPASLLTAT